MSHCFLQWFCQFILPPAVLKYTLFNPSWIFDVRLLNLCPSWGGGGWERIPHCGFTLYFPSLMNELLSILAIHMFFPRRVCLKKQLICTSLEPWCCGWLGAVGEGEGVLEGGEYCLKVQSGTGLGHGCDGGGRLRDVPSLGNSGWFKKKFFLHYEVLTDLTIC